MEANNTIKQKNNLGTLRLFFAFNSSWEWNKAIVDIQSKILPKDIRLNREANLHLTLLFLGTVNSNDLLKMISKIRMQFPINFELPKFTKPRLRKVDTRNGGMVWIEFEKNKVFSKISQDIYNLSKEFCPQINFREHPIPHITIARFKKNQEIVMPESVCLPEFFAPKSIELWASCSGVGGLIYLPLFCFLTSDLENK